MAPENTGKGSFLACRKFLQHSATFFDADYLTIQRICIPNCSFRIKADSVRYPRTQFGKHSPITQATIVINRKGSETPCSGLGDDQETSFFMDDNAVWKIKVIRYEPSRSLQIHHH